MKHKEPTELIYLAILVAIADYHQKVGEWPTIETVLRRVNSYGLRVSEAILKIKIKKLAKNGMAYFITDDPGEPFKWLYISENVEESLNELRNMLLRLLEEKSNE